MNHLCVDLYSEDKVDSFADAYAAGVRLVILKASEGATVRDHTYVARRAAALSAGLLVGAYHFMRWTPVDDQIANFLSAAHPNPGDDTRLVMDWETNDASVAMAREFLTKLDAKTGRKTIVYSYASFLQEHLGNTADTFFGSHPLWLAAYRDVAPKPQVSWDKLFLWQNTDKAVIPGLPGVGGVDASHYEGTEDGLRLSWLGAVNLEPQPAPPAAVPSEVDVLAYQTKLAALGFYKGDLDGDRGPMTNAALQDYAISTLTKEGN